MRKDDDISMIDIGPVLTIWRRPGFPTWFPTNLLQAYRSLQRKQVQTFHSIVRPQPIQTRVCSASVIHEEDKLRMLSQQADTQSLCPACWDTDLKEPALPAGSFSLHPCSSSSEREPVQTVCSGVKHTLTICKPSWSR